MGWRKWKWPVVGWASLAAALWALLYGLYWHDRTYNRVFWGDALVNWIGDVVMLQWVRSYQPLLGGILTVVAGAGVLLAAKMQLDFQKRGIEATRQDARAAQIMNDRAILGAVRIVFGVVRQGFIDNEGSNGLQAITRLAQYDKDLHRIQPALAEVVFLSARQAERGLVHCGATPGAEPNSPGAKLIARGHAYAVLVHYFLMPDFIRFDAAGEFIFTKKPPEEVLPIIKHTGITDLSELPWATAALIIGMN